MIQINKQAVKPVSIVGSGPGKPELLTCRAIHVLEQSEVLLYDDLAGHDIIDIIPSRIKKIYVGKRYLDGMDQQKRLDTITNYYQHYFAEGKKLVRLKGGDAMIFSRADEELSFLQRNGIDFEVVPGLTSGLAGANLAAMPLTVRQKVRSLVMLTANTVDGTYDLPQQIMTYLDIHANIMIYMGGSMFEMVVEKLKLAGRYNDVQVVLISKISMPSQKIISGTIMDIEGKLDVNIETPVVVYIGRELEVYGNENTSAI